MSFFCAMRITQGSHEYGRDACARVEDDREASGAQRGPNASETSSQRFERSSTDFFFSYEKQFQSRFPQVGTIYASISKLIANRQEISPGIYCSKTERKGLLAFGVSKRYDGRKALVVTDVKLGESGGEAQ